MAARAARPALARRKMRAPQPARKRATHGLAKAIVPARRARATGMLERVGLKYFERLRFERCWQKSAADSAEDLRGLTCTWPQDEPEGAHARVVLQRAPAPATLR